MHFVSVIKKNAWFNVICYWYHENTKRGWFKELDNFPFVSLWLFITLLLLHNHISLTIGENKNSKHSHWSHPNPLMDESSIPSLLGTSFVHEDIVTPQWLSTWINLKFNIRVFNGIL